MTREIKFRAYHFGADYSVRPEMLYDTKLGDVLRWKQEGQDLSDVMQYTGLKDSKGVEIYEGDIVEVNHHESDEWKWRETVIFHLSCFMVGDEDLLSNLIPDIEVIGNIYESEEQQ